MSRRVFTRLARSGVSCTLVLLLAIGLTTGCGDKKSEVPESEDQGKELGDSTEFSVDPEVDRFYGPTPLTVHFSTTVKNAGGPVKWEWAFGDGTTSTEASPVHTFTTPGVYQVGVAGTNAKGEREGGAVDVRAMTEEEVAMVRAKDEAAKEEAAQRAQKEAAPDQAPAP
jgi:hypothetical protein